jgi:hypothetical protein
MAKEYFPGFDKCMRMMRSRDGTTSESGFSWLSLFARAYVGRLKDELERETNHGFRCWLLELIGMAKDPDTIGLFAKYLDSGDDSYRFWAIAGLENLDTADSRRLLFEAGVRD